MSYATNSKVPVSAFIDFVAKQAYPSRLLWVKSTDMAMRKWRGNWTCFVWLGDPMAREATATNDIAIAMTQNRGVALEALCKTDTWTICRITVPTDGSEAGQLLIPQTGFKYSVRANPLPTIVVQHKAVWQFLKWILPASDHHSEFAL